MTEADDRLGRIVGGKYRLDALIGEGGLGRVYRARHLDLGAEIAVKFLSSSPGRENRERFRREARALATLKHPGIVSVIDFGEEGGELYLAMELVVGSPLAEHMLVDGVPMAFPRVVDVARQILAVLEVTHGAGVVHRDLKPDNVMLARMGDRSEHVKVLDFGIALFVEEPGAARLTETHGVQGTPMYMSPEQCRGRDVGPAADVYAMGAVLYEMLAGEPPFDAPSVVELMARHLYVSPVPVAERGVGRVVPAELEQLALRAMSKQPEARPTAAEMRDELDGYVRGTSEAAVAHRAVEERVRAVGLSRSQRGLPRAPESQGAEVASEVEVRVHAWGLSPARVEDLQTALSVHGIRLIPWPGEGPPPASGSDGRMERAVVIPADGRAVERLVALHGRVDGGKVPVLAADARPEATAGLVRAGASDVALSMVGDEILCAKLGRLVRRGR